MVLLLCIILLLGYMIVQRERELRLLREQTSTTTTLMLADTITARELLDIAGTHEEVKKFISQGDYDIYIDVLDETDFNRLPAIYKDIPREDLFQINYTRQERALLVILNPAGVIKVVPVTNLRIL